MLLYHHYHYQVCSLTLSWHLCLLSITPSKSSRQHPVSTTLCLLANPGISMSLLECIADDFTLLLRQCLTRLVHLTWTVREMGDKWLNSSHFIGCGLQDFSKQHIAFLCNFHPAFSLCISFVSRWCIYTATFCKKSLFILSEWSNINMINNLSIAEHDFATHMLISLSVNEILLPGYMNN